MPLYYPPLVDASGQMIVQPASQARVVHVTQTRATNTTPYSANTVIGPQGGGSSAIELPLIGDAGSVIMLIASRLWVGMTAVPSGMSGFRAFLYNVTPPSALADGAAFAIPSGDRAAFLGTIDVGAPAAFTNTLHVTVNGQNHPIPLLTTSAWMYLVTIGAHTPESGTVFDLALTSLRV